MAERASHYSQTGLRSGADWKLDKHQVALKFSPSRMLAARPPGGIAANRHPPPQKKNAVWEWRKGKQCCECVHTAGGGCVCVGWVVSLFADFLLPSVRFKHVRVRRL